MQLPTFFIVLGLPRTGSNLLLSALDAHSQVGISGELFMEHEPSRKLYGRTAGGAYYHNDTDGAAFLTEHVFHGQYDQEIRAIGFKLFFDHAASGSASSVWSRLVMDHSVRVIRIQRQNLLDSYLSHEIALRTGEWWCSPKQRPAVLPAFPLDASSLERFFEQAVERETWADEAFCSHPSLVVQYERDLLHDYEACVGCVQSFLGLSHQVISPRIRKQATRPPSEQISNYHDLKKTFRPTAFAAFFP
jgi:LPS sulfotransferase NodH